MIALLLVLGAAWAQVNDTTTTVVSNATTTVVSNATTTTTAPGNATLPAEPFAVTDLIKLTALDNSTSQWIDTYLAQAPADPKLFRNQLVVILGDVRTPTSSYTSLLRTCAGQGYHCVVLPYPNTLVAGTACSSIGGDCVPLYREQVITGAKKTSILTLPLEDSIEARLSRLLNALTLAFAVSAWIQFRAEGWRTRVAFVGIGEGGSYAAFWACRLQEAQRLVLVNAPSDRDPKSLELSPWLSSGTCKTPRDRMFAMYHTQAEFCSSLVEGLDALGVKNDATEITRYVPEVPAEVQDWCSIKATRLCSNLPSASKNRIDAGSSLTVDSQLPRLMNGEIEYERVWRYLLGSNAVCTALLKEVPRGSCACAAAAGFQPLTIGLAVGLSALVLALIALGVFLWWKKKKAKSAW